MTIDEDAWDTLRQSLPNDPDTVFMIRGAIAIYETSRTTREHGTAFTEQPQAGTGDATDEKALAAAYLKYNYHTTCFAADPKALAKAIKEYLEALGHGATPEYRSVTVLSCDAELAERDAQRVETGKPCGPLMTPAMGGDLTVVCLKCGQQIAWIDEHRNGCPSSANPWHPHNGDECPVSGDTMVDVRYKNGELSRDNPARASSWIWNEDCGDFSVAEYRIVKPESPGQAGGDA